MVNCCVPFCKSDNRKNKDISFHEFPSDNDQTSAWLKAISRKDFLPNANSNSSRVCSKHFKDDDYVQHTTRRRLKPKSVPSVFPGYPSYKVPVDVNPRKIRKRKFENYASDTSKRRQHTDSSIADVQDANLLLNFSHVIQNNNEDDIQYVDSANSFRDGESEIEFDMPAASNFSEQHSQTKIDMQSIAKMHMENRRLKKLLYSKNKEISSLKEKLTTVNDKLDYYKKNVYFSNVEKMEVLEGEGLANNHILFLLSQIKNFDNKTPRWSENIIRECVLLHSISPKAYKTLINRNLLRLPSSMTLNRYVGPVTGDTGFTELIRQRLEEECNNLKPMEKYCSLVVDEMAIKPQCIYDAKLDTFFGSASNGNENNDLYVQANRLLCFTLNGLSTKFCIPCGYYFTKQLNGAQLYKKTLNILKSVEGCGFLVVRIVADNHKTNTTMFKLFGNGKLLPSVVHPCDPKRKLFLSFDQNHIIKNIRSLFLENDMTDGHEIKSGNFVKLLYLFQKEYNVKAVRNLTMKHIEPTNIEKMNVGRAVLIFSPPVTAALKFLHRHSERHPRAQSFKNASATIKFLENFYKWFSIHDTCNRTRHVTQRDSNKMHFFSTDDERLVWLQNFLQYLSDLQNACAAHDPPLKFLSKETYEAITLTTNSTISCVKYLLNNNFYYVLTRSFNSDAIESLFSSLRQMNGGNDMLDARATIFSLEKILKIGIITSSEHSNVGQINYKSDNVSKNVKKSLLSRKASDLPVEIVNVLNEIQGDTRILSTNLKTSSLAYVAGYIIRTIELDIMCLECLDSLSGPDSSSPLLSLIVFQDRGGLRYPSGDFIFVLGIIQKFIEQAVKILPLTNVSNNLNSYIIPYLLKSPILKCTLLNHKEKLANHICMKFVPLLLKNIAKRVIIRPNLLNKPRSRKVLKLT